MNRDERTLGLLNNLCKLSDKGVDVVTTLWLIACAVCFVVGYLLGYLVGGWRGF